MTQANNIEKSTATTEAPVEGNYFVSAYPPFSCWTRENAEKATGLFTEPNSISADVPLGLYIHIPFCTVRCHYCYYLSHANKSEDLIDNYVEMLIKEAKLYGGLCSISNRQMNFAYLGGGTPSILSAAQVSRLLEGIQRVFPWRGIEEVTFECSPKTIELEKLQAMKDAGVTRISMGVQQLNDEILKQNGRVHLVTDVERAYEMITKVGFEVVNLDLIVGLVGETDTTFMESLDKMLGMNPDSVTIYQLEIPKNTPLYHLYHSDSLQDSPASWSAKRSRLIRGFRQLERSGYQLRSAYTAARTDKARRFIYQDAQYKGADLIGLGASSFSYYHGAHYQNLTSLKHYMEHVNAGELPIERAYFLNEEERLVREFILQLKLGAVDRRYFQTKFNVDIFHRFEEPISDFVSQGLMFRDGNQLNLTREGLVQVDHLVLAFYLPAHRGVRYS